MADIDFPGYLSNTKYISSGISTTVLRKVNMAVNYNFSHFNIALDTMYGNAPFSDNLNFSVSYAFNYNHSISIALFFESVAITWLGDTSKSEGVSDGIISQYNPSVFSDYDTNLVIITETEIIPLDTGVTELSLKLNDISDSTKIISTTYIFTIIKNDNYYSIIHSLK